ncbi:MAG: hypothetical protein SGBAC_005661 [Bacillariaceae sp.]
MAESSAFHMQSPNAVRSSHPPSSTSSLASTTSADILARARKAAGVPEEEKLFEDPLLDNMQQCLLTLETRVKDGPGSIPLLEIEEFQVMANNILADMKEKENERLNALSSGSAPVAAAVAPADAPPAIEAQLAAASPTIEDTAKVEETETETVIPDTSEDDGPAYEGSGGMGLAKGTANTWIIDGMDSMTPEEYQAAIQASVSARQAERKKQGKTGNRWSNDYLNTLNGGNDGGMLKK